MRLEPAFTPELDHERVRALQLPSIEGWGDGRVQHPSRRWSRPKAAPGAEGHPPSSSHKDNAENASRSSAADH